MGNWSLGSVSDFVYSVVDGIPTAISGAIMLQIADQQRNYVEERTGATIGSNSISIQYQSVIWKLTAAGVCDSINLVGLKGQSVTMGDFSITKGASNATTTSAESFREAAEKEFEMLGTVVRYYKALG